MRYLLAILFPWAAFFTIGRVGSGVLCLLLQITILGWLPASLWAMFSVSGYLGDKRSAHLIREMEGRLVPQDKSPEDDFGGHERGPLTLPESPSVVTGSLPAVSISPSVFEKPLPIDSPPLVDSPLLSRLPPNVVKAGAGVICCFLLVAAIFSGGRQQPSIKPLPLVVEFRESLVGFGKVMVVTNTGTETLQTCSVVIHGLDRNNAEPTELGTLPANGYLECGWRELKSGQLNKGSRVTISSPGFYDKSVLVP